jgi:hypothetical protein
MKKQPKKLILSRETIQLLSAESLSQVNGGNEPIDGGMTEGTHCTANASCISCTGTCMNC